MNCDGFGRLCIGILRKDYYFKVQTEDYRVQVIYILPWEMMNEFQLIQKPCKCRKSADLVRPKVQPSSLVLKEFLMMVDARLCSKQFFFLLPK